MYRNWAFAILILFIMALQVVFPAVHTTSSFSTISTMLSSYSRLNPLSSSSRTGELGDNLSTRILSTESATRLQSTTVVQTTSTGPVWPQFQHDALHSGVSSFLGPSTGSLLWQYQLGNPGSGASGFSSPSIAPDGTIYVGNSCGPCTDSIFAINPYGTLKWEFNIPQNSNCVGGIEGAPAVGSDGTIYAASDAGVVYALNPDGSLKWQTQDCVSLGASYIDTSPTIGPSGTVYVASYWGTIYAFNPDGSQQWSYQLNSGYIKDTSAVATDGTVYFGTTDGFLYALTSGGSLKWKFPSSQTGVTNGFRSSPSIGSDGTVYIGGGDGNLYSVTSSGALKWKFATASIVYASPAVGSDGTIYVGSSNDNFYAVSPSGSLKWSFATGGVVYSSPILDSAGTIYFASEDDYIYALNPNGVLKWKYNVGTVFFASPALSADGTLIITGGDQNLFALSSGCTNQWKNCSLLNVQNEVLTPQQLVGSIPGVSTVSNPLLTAFNSYLPEVDLLSPPCSSCQAVFTQTMTSTLAVSLPTGYLGYAIVVHIPIIPILNRMICLPFTQTCLNLPLNNNGQPYQLGTNQGVLGITPLITLTSDGSLNMVYTVSGKSSSLSAAAQTFLDIANEIESGVGLLVKSLTDPAAIAGLTLQALKVDAELGDETLTIITSDLTATGPLSGYRVYDFDDMVDSIEGGVLGKILTTTLDIMSLCSHLAEGIAEVAGIPVTEGASAIPLPITIGQVAVDTVKVGVDFSAFIPGIDSNPVYQTISSAIGIVSPLSDPNGATIVPSYYEPNGTLAIGYSASQNSINYQGNSGLLIGTNQSYLAFLFENSSSPSPYQFQMKGIGPVNNTIPYSAHISSYNSTLNPLIYSGMVLSNSSTTISIIPLRNGTIAPPAALEPRIHISGGGGSYSIDVNSFLSNGTRTAASACYLVLNGTQYTMTENNATVFHLDLNYFASNSTMFSVYTVSPSFPGGFLQSALPPSLLGDFNSTSGGVGPSVTFTGQASGGIPPYSFSWNFGDGTTSTGSSVSHTYALAGNYPVALTITDSGNTTSQMWRVVHSLNVTSGSVGGLVLPIDRLALLAPLLLLAAIVACSYVTNAVFQRRKTFKKASLIRS